MTECELMENLRKEVGKHELVTIVVKTQLFTLKDTFKSKNIVLNYKNGIEICIASDDLEDDREYVISNFSGALRVYDEAYDIATYKFYNNDSKDSAILNFL